MKGANSPHIFAPAPSYRTDACSGVARSKAADERCVMADVLDFRQEAKGCLHLAEAETNPDVRTVLMGMALGWLTLASEKDAQSPLEDESADRLV